MDEQQNFFFSIFPLNEEVKKYCLNKNRIGFAAVRQIRRRLSSRLNKWILCIHVELHCKHFHRDCWKIISRAEIIGGLSLSSRIIKRFVLNAKYVSLKARDKASTTKRRIHLYVFRVTCLCRAVAKSKTHEDEFKESIRMKKFDCFRFIIKCCDD